MIEILYFDINEILNGEYTQYDDEGSVITTINNICLTEEDRDYLTNLSITDNGVVGYLKYDNSKKCYYFIKK